MGANFRAYECFAMRLTSEAVPALREPHFALFSESDQRTCRKVLNRTTSPGRIVHRKDADPVPYKCASCLNQLRAENSGRRKKRAFEWRLCSSADCLQSVRVHRSFHSTIRHGTLADLLGKRTEGYRGKRANSSNILVDKHFSDLLPKSAGNFEGQTHVGVKTALFNGGDGLARHAHLGGQLCL